jgi:hypothetical protein
MRPAAAGIAVQVDHIVPSGQLAKIYGFTDLDGSQPDAWRYVAELQDAGKPADVTGYRWHLRQAGSLRGWHRGSPDHHEWREAKKATSLFNLLRHFQKRGQWVNHPTGDKVWQIDKLEEVSMRRAMRRIHSLIEILTKVQRLEIEERLKSKIRETWLKVFFLNRYNSKNKTANIVGFDVRFLDYEALSYLYNEIFIDNSYYFAAENETPYIIDCGSNIGMSILYFKTLYPNSRILAFEPGE